jgi:hypothetical protein
VPLRPLLALLILAAVAVTTPSALAQATPVDRPAELRGGTCSGLGDVVVPLAHLVITEGDLQGQTSATPVEQSGTVVQFDIADFLVADHAVVVRESPQDSTVVACGDVGGAMNPDGTLAVGMLGINGSGLSGVAYFTPIDTFENTLVTILLVNHGEPVTVSVEDETGTGEGVTDVVEEAAGAVKDVTTTTETNTAPG